MSDDNENVPEKESAALIPLEEKTVDFYGDQITAVLVEPTSGHQEVYVPLKPISDYLGLSWAGQLERIKRDPVLSEFLRGIRVTRIPKGEVSGGLQESTSLPLEYLPGWLFGINANRVKTELRDKIIRYQRDCYRALWKAFKEEAEATPFTTTTQQGRTVNWREPNPVLVQIRQQALVMAKMAEEQMEIEAKALDALDQAHYAHQRIDEFYLFANELDQKIGKIDQKVDDIDHKVDDIEQRVGDIDQTVRPGAIISEAQASVIVNTVKALAEYLTTKNPKKNHYQSIFGELSRRFQVGTYRRIKQADYPAVLALLDELQRSAGGEGIHTQSLLPLDPTPEA